MKKILITGGSGLLALNWASAIRDSYDVILGLHKKIVSLEGVKTVLLKQDYEELKQLIVSIEPDIIIHTAGITIVELCEMNPKLAFEVNVNLAEQIARISAEIGSALIHISTDHLFKGLQPNVTEQTTPDPVNEYGKTKLLAEQRVFERNPDALVIRTNFFGWGPGYRSSFSDTILNTIRTGKEISLFNDVYFTPILMQSLITCSHKLMDKREKGVFHVVCDSRISKYEFGILLAEEFKLDKTLIKPIQLASKTGLTCRPYDMSLSNSKICSVLGVGQLGHVSDHIQLLHQLESDSTINYIRKL